MAALLTALRVSAWRQTAGLLLYDTHILYGTYSFHVGLVFFCFCLLSEDKQSGFFNKKILKLFYRVKYTTVNFLEVPLKHAVIFLQCNYIFYWLLLGLYI